MKPEVKDLIDETKENLEFFDMSTESVDKLEDAIEENSGVHFVYDTEQVVAKYSLHYVVNNPPAYAKSTSGKAVWGEAFKEYLRRKGVDPEKLDKHKEIKNVQWPEVVRIFNTLMGKKNRPRNEESLKRKDAKVSVASLKIGQTAIFASPKNKEMWVVYKKQEHYDPENGPRGEFETIPIGMFSDEKVANEFAKKHKAKEVEKQMMSASDLKPGSHTLFDMQLIFDKKNQAWLSPELI